MPHRTPRMMQVVLDKGKQGRETFWRENITRAKERARVLSESHGGCKIVEEGETLVVQAAKTYQNFRRVKPVLD